ncbi:MAG: RsmE family RNA methyltransferase [Sphaerochaetaceae bacterium]
MRQYILPETYNGAPSLVLRGKESQYLSRVLRLKKGQQILGRDREGTTYQLTLQQIDKTSCTLLCQKIEGDTTVYSTDVLPSFCGPYPNLVLMQCVCKGKKEEQIIRQATEIGVSQIVLIQSSYCVPDRLDKDEKAITARFDRLNRQVKEALQQSGSPIPTELVPQVVPLSDLPHWWNNRGPVLFFHQSVRTEKQKSFGEYIRTSSMETPIALLVGPEGGFSEEECTFLETAGFHPVLLKTNILRSETAGLYALSALQVHMTEWNTKPVHLSKQE